MNGEGRLDAMGGSVTGHARVTSLATGGPEDLKQIDLLLYSGLSVQTTYYAGGLRLLLQHSCEGERNFSQIAQTCWVGQITRGEVCRGP